MDEQKQKPTDTPKLDFKNPDVRKKVAELLVSGVTQEEISLHYFGYKHANSLSLLLHRAGGTDAVIREALDEDAVRRYRAQVAETTRIPGRRGGRDRRFVEGGLDEDVRRDPSQGQSPERFSGLGEKEQTWVRHKIKSEGIHTEAAVSPSHAKKIVREIARAVSIRKHEAEVRPLLESLIDSVSRSAPASQNIPATIMYAKTSTATGGAVDEAVKDENMKGESIVIRVRLPKLQTSQAETATARGRVAEFIGTLREEIERSHQANSRLGQMLRRPGKQRKIELQLMWGGTPIVLASATFT